MVIVWVYIIVLNCIWVPPVPLSPKCYQKILYKIEPFAHYSPTLFLLKKVLNTNTLNLNFFFKMWFSYIFKYIRNPNGATKTQMQFWKQFPNVTGSCHIQLQKVRTTTKTRPCRAQSTRELSGAFTWVASSRWIIQVKWAQLVKAGQSAREF